MVETIFAEAYQGPISFAEDAALVDEYILRDRASLVRGNESIPLLIGKPTDREKKAALKLVDTHARKDLARKNINWFRNRSSPQQHPMVHTTPCKAHHLQVPRSFWSDMVGSVETANCGSSGCLACLPLPHPPYPIRLVLAVVAAAPPSVTTLHAVSQHSGLTATHRR